MAARLAGRAYLGSYAGNRLTARRMRAPGNKARGVEDARKSFCRIERLRGGCRAGELHERGKAPRAFDRDSQSNRESVGDPGLRTVIESNNARRAKQ